MPVCLKTKIVVFKLEHGSILEQQAHKEVVGLGHIFMRRGTNNVRMCQIKGGGLLFLV